MLTGKWNMTGVEGEQMNAREVNILSFSDDGHCRMEKKRGEGDDVKIMEAAFEYDETAQQVTLKEDGESVAQFDVIEPSESKMVMKMGPDVCTYEKM